MPWEAGFGRRRWWLTLLAVATWEAGCGGAGGWLQKGEEADCNNMLPIAMTWEAGFGRRRWWLTLLAAATWEAGLMRREAACNNSSH